MQSYYLVVSANSIPQMHRYERARTRARLGQSSEKGHPA